MLKTDRALSPLKLKKAYYEVRLRNRGKSYVKDGQSPHPIEAKERVLRGKVKEQR
jgi:hypothetical protein